MRLICESEYQLFMKCKDSSSNIPCDNTNLTLFNNPRLPEDIKLGLYSSVIRKSRKRFLEGLEVKHENQKVKTSIALSFLRMSLNLLYQLVKWLHKQKS